MSKTKYKLDNVAINDVLPLKAARRDAIANLKCFGPRTPETKLRWLHLHSVCGATLFGSHQRHVFPPVWQRLVGLGFVCNPWEAQCRIYEGLVRTLILF